MCIVRFIWDSIDKMLHSRCSIETNSLHPPEWPSDPRAVTEVIPVSLPKGLQPNLKTAAS